MSDKKIARKARHSVLFASAGLAGLFAAGVIATPALAEGTTAAADATTTTTASLLPADVVVTAMKRATTAQTTPMSISAVSGAELAGRGFTDFSALAQSTPNVSLKDEGPGQTEIELRGMTSSGGNSPTVGFYLDDIPLTSPANAQNGKVVINPALYDLSRVEVLRGPQGTLYGSGSMGGTVRLITNAPSTRSYQATADGTLSGTLGGGVNHIENLMVNLPLVEDKLALRIVGTENYTSGWIDRIVASPFPLVSPDGTMRGDVAHAPVQKRYPRSNDSWLNGFRANLLWRPTADLSLNFGVFVQNQKANGISAFDSVPGGEHRYQPFDISEPSTDKIAIYSLNVNYDLGFVDITSSTAAWRRRSTQIEDGSEDFNNPLTGATYASNYGLPNLGYYGPNGSGQVFGYENDPSHQFSEELRFASKGEGKLMWVGGLFYSSFASTWTFAGTSLNPSAYMDIGTFAPATTTHWFDAYEPSRMTQSAVFGDATYAVTDRLKADIGLRWYSYDNRFASVISGWGSAFGAAMPASPGVIKQSESGFNPKFNLSYSFDRDLMLYATAAKGFRPGGGNAQYATTGAYWSAVFAPYNYPGGKWPASYKSDAVWSYEVGEKARLFERRLTLNASLYYEDWEHIQLESLPGDWPVNINGQRAKIYGGEIEAKAVLGHGFELSASGGVTHAQVNPGPYWQIVPQHKLSDVAPVTGDVVLSYERPLNNGLTLVSQVESSYVGQRYSLSFPPGYTLNGAYTPLPGYDLTNLRATLKSDDQWSVALFVNNVFNTHAQLENLLQETLPSAAYNRVVTNQPLTAGIYLSLKR